MSSSCQGNNFLSPHQADISMVRIAPVEAQLIGGRIILENSDPARELFNSMRFGEKGQDNKVEISLHEAVYLLEKSQLRLISNNKEIDADHLIKKAAKSEPNFMVRHAVFRDFRNRGYVIKTALKFGAEFRVYDRGVKPGEDHAKWIVFPVKESEGLTWHDFSAKNRVAHSTKKRLLIACVDQEGDVTYWEVRWLRP